MLAAVDEETSTLLGTIGVYPDRDVGGTFYHLAGLDVAHEQKGQGIEHFLLGEIGRFLRAHRVTRLKFAASPLLTGAAELYITRFGARYRWREGTRTPEGRPWPYVSGECDFDDPLERPLDLREEEVVPRSVLDWEGLVASPRQGIVYSGPLSVLLPDLTADLLADAARADPRFLATLFDVFHALYLHGYGFAWFDRLPSRLVPEGGARCYYVMNRLLAL